MIAARELGEIRGYRGLHAEDYMADASGAFTFRHDPAGGGALADIGSHALATAEYLLKDFAGPITSQGRLRDDDRRTPGRQGGERRVEVDDVGRAFLRFANGATGSMKAIGSRLAARCSTISRSMGRRARSPSARNASTNYIFSPPATARTSGVSPHRSRAGASALRSVLRGGRPSARLQRPQSDRSRRVY